MDSTTMLMWLELVLVPWAKGTKTVLVVDNCSSHCGAVVRAAAEGSGVLLDFLPPNTTGVLQPMDVTVNQPLKAAFRRVRGHEERADLVVWRQRVQRAVEEKTPIPMFAPAKMSQVQGIQTLMRAWMELQGNDALAETLRGTFVTVGLSRSDLHGGGYAPYNEPTYRVPAAVAAVMPSPSFDLAELMVPVEIAPSRRLRRPARPAPAAPAASASSSGPAAPPTRDDEGDASSDTVESEEETPRNRRRQRPRQRPVSRGARGLRARPRTHGPDSTHHGGIMASASTSSGSLEIIADHIVDPRDEAARVILGDAGASDGETDDENDDENDDEDDDDLPPHDGSETDTVNSDTEVENDAEDGHLSS
jgi:hypothetical protein